MLEKENLEKQTQDGNNKFISEKAYSEIAAKIGLISKTIERGKTKLNREDLL